MSETINSPMLAIIPDASGEALARQIAAGLGFADVHLVVGTIADAVDYIAPRHLSPSYILIDINGQMEGVIASLDALAPLCDPGTRVVVTGDRNDIHFYRKLLDRGVIDYLPNPANPDDVLKAFQQNMQATAEARSNSKVFTFMSAAAGDGSSTAALNAAFALSEAHKKSTILVDMDYQFGMVARNLALTSPFGIRELFEHSDRNIDSTLIGRMAAKYSDHLHVIAAPNDLRFPPTVKPETVRDLISALKQHYDIVVLDVPHVWSTWTSAAASASNKVVVAAQLWLKSVTHASRMLNAMRETGIAEHDLRVVINRSGSKYKEAVSSRDFERVCNTRIAHYLSNDIRTVVQAENEGKTIMELGDSDLRTEFNQLGNMLLPYPTQPATETATPKPLSFLKRLG